MRRTSSIPLEQRAAHLQRACVLGQGVVDETVSAHAEEILEKVARRQGIGAEYTVIGLFGATGSGKSSLFNALVGREEAKVAATRPTTAQPTAAIWGTADPTALLDWLQIERVTALDEQSGLTTVAAQKPSLLRRVLRPGEQEAEPRRGGLVLVDLPDIDSIQRGNREVVQRFAARADVMVWVFDPQKYADDVIHRQLIEPLAAHGGGMLAVLNQVDRLSAADRAEISEDLSAHLSADGAAKLLLCPPVAVSARTGEGMEQLTAAIAPVVAGREAVWQRLEADLDGVADLLAQQDGGELPEGVTGAAVNDLAWGFAEAVGAERLVEASRASQRRAAQAHIGWPPLRMARRALRDPLAKVGITRPTGPGAGISRQDLPTWGAGGEATARGAVRSSAQAAAEGTGQPWHAAIREAARAEQEHLEADLERAVSGADFEQGARRWWWAPLNLLQWAALVTALFGLLWIGGWWVGEYFRLGLPEPPAVGRTRIPWPSALALGGLGAGAVLSLLVAPWVIRASTARHARRVRGRLLQGFREVAEVRVGDPMRAVIERQREYREQVAAAGCASRRSRR